MFVETFYPENPILKRYIEYYYFLKTDSPDFNINYYSFPHTLNSFNIHKNANCEIKSFSANIYEDQENKNLTIVQGYRIFPLLVNLRGRLDKVTILFKPLGLNSFLKRSFKEAAGNHSQIFTEWNGRQYTAFLNKFYDTNDNKRRVLLLENFLLTRYKPREQEESFQKALIQLTDFENEYSIQEIAQNISLNVRTFNRLFHTYFGISPVSFKKIARFRHSMKNKLFSNQFKSLTEIGHESNFYDQPYFNKTYKNITGKSPSEFFNSIEKLADNQLIFEFIDK